MREVISMSTKTFEVNESNFTTDVLNSDKPVLVDFWAEWCGPCKMIAPLVDQLATEYGEKIKVGKLDADENQDVLMRYGVMSIPTLILFKGGQPVVRITGFQPKERIANQLKPHLV
ncbi:MAG TPA: thioredoxin [Phototrophicaceae bacterium]|nr:thioredoxin [Phototrophicaceae bacterium]